MANSADPDQLASSEANWSGSTLFAKKDISGFSRTRVNILFLFCLENRLEGISSIANFITTYESPNKTEAPILYL